MYIFSIFFNMKVCSMFSLESPDRGDSNEYTQYTIFNIKKKKIHYINQTLQPCDFSKGLKNGFETAVVNEPSVFEPLKFYCIIYDLFKKIKFCSALGGYFFLCKTASCDKNTPPLQVGWAYHRFM